MIVFTNVAKRFGAVPVLRGVSLTVRPGSVHYVIGESGAGKSVLIKQVVGLIQPDSGSIVLDGQELVGLDERSFRSVRERCQLIFQSATLFDALTILENVAMPLRRRFALEPADAKGRARAALARVRALDVADRLPSEIGPGLRKRVAVARALALEPRVLLYDEPTTSLDPVSARRTDRLIRDTATALGITSMVVSHDLISVRTGDRVSFLHDGQVRFDGPPTELFESDDPLVRRFVNLRAN